ncbi:hypothetical protein FRC08_013654 [Ceratobasidium sp. 394]|nr:hypothetical protein FRC08_013654 [Ceratobasidium sp. 394]KAG9097562.1 hypothetical protein FS749_006011 [Ceratobasidium sp. UAMH 11750]
MSNVNDTPNAAKMNHHISLCFLDGLPDEMLIRILLFCGYRDMLSFSAVCKRYHNIVSSSVVLQLHIELEANGLQIARDVSVETRDYLSLLERLRRYRDAWLDLDLGPPVQLRGGDEDMPLWELRDGVFVKSYHGSGGQLSTNKPNFLRLIPLDSANNASTQVNFGVNFGEFSLDASQNLAVLVDIDGHAEECYGWIRLCSSVTGQAHPLAAHPVLTAKLGFQGLSYDHAIEIKHELVVVQFSWSISAKYGHEVLIWDWKKGTLLNRISRNDSICIFALLDSDRLILWSVSADEDDTLNSMSLLVYEQISSSRPEIGGANGQRVDTLSFPSLSPSLTFRFPKLQDSSSISTPRLCSMVSDYGSGASLATYIPFATSRALTLGLSMYIHDSESDNPLRIFVDVDQLLHHLDRAKQQAIHTLAWKDWGENATRGFRADTPNDWIRCVFGSRFSMRDAHISIIEFHTPTVRRHAHRRRSTYIPLARSPDAVQSRESRIFTGVLPNFLSYDGIYMSGEANGTTLRKDDVLVDTVESDQPTYLPYFDEPVVSRLPYRIVTRIGPADRHAGWLISGNHVVGIRHLPGSDWSTGDLTVYAVGGNG